MTPAESRAESVIEDLERSLEADAADAIQSNKKRLDQLTSEIDAEYQEMFSNRTVQIDGQDISLSITSDEDMQKMAKSEPEVRAAAQCRCHVRVVSARPQKPANAMA